MGISPVEPANKAIQGLTSWDSMARLVTAFGGGNQALVAIGIIALSVVVIVAVIGFVAYLCNPVPQYDENRHRQNRRQGKIEMSAFVAVIASSASVAAASAVIAWGVSAISRIKSFDHNMARFTAGVLALQADATVPASVTAYLEELAPFVSDRFAADVLVKQRGPFKKELSADKLRDLESLTPKQATAFLQTATSLLLAFSFRSSRYGKQFRQRLLDKSGDRETVVAQTKQLHAQISHGELCAA